MLIPNVDYFLSWVVHFLLIVTRISALFIMTPLLSRQNIPNPAKIGLSLLMAAIVINFAPPPVIYPYNDLYSLGFAVLRELMVGLIIGVVTLFFFNIVYTAAHVIDIQIGFSMAQTFDPAIGAQAAVTSTLLNFVLVVSFVLTGGFTQLIRTITRTFEVIPVGGGVFRPEAIQLVIDIFIRCFALAVQVAMPVLASALILEVALGIIVRTAPQMNIFVVGIPLKVLIGLIVLMLMLPVFAVFSERIFSELFENIDRMLGGMIP
jgi:flagellar biosynthetic protein FliR